MRTTPVYIYMPTKNKGQTLDPWIGPGKKENLWENEGLGQMGEREREIQASSHETSKAQE